MPTPAERKALLFLAGVIVLGASVRVVRAARDDGASDVANRQALARQIAAVDSAHGAEGKRRGSGKGSTRSLKRRREPRGERDSSSSIAMPLPVVDVDVASASEIEALPRIGAALARRIVDDRSANGAFGSLEGFQRVRGIGPALAASLSSRVTFSGTARPSNAVADPRLRSPLTSSKSPRRERKK
jgi:DNA uptake protein ComE-like DNA-binding protein